LRHQYQQAAASGLHNGLDPQQINPFNQWMMMQHPPVDDDATSCPLFLIYSSNFDSDA